MADLSNITALSGLTITSDQTTGTNNPNATFAVSNVTTAQRDLLQNVTPYVVNNVTYKVKPGTVIFNITTGFLQIFDFVNNAGIWQNVLSINTTATGVGLTNGTPFVYPSGTATSVEVSANQVNGFIYNDTTNNQVRGYINTQWMTLFTVATTATGVGLTNGAPFVYPSGTATSVEVPANEVNGFTYYDTTSNTLKTRINGTWKTVTTA